MFLYVICFIQCTKRTNKVIKNVVDVSMFDWQKHKTSDW